MHPRNLDVTIGGELIHTTDEHPLLVVLEDELQWTEAKHLSIGDDMILASDGSTGMVEAVQVIDEPQTMYNLTISLVATYLVGEQGWVVHNVSKKNKCEFVPEVQNFIDKYYIGNDTEAKRELRKELQKYANQAGGGLERKADIAALPYINSSQLTDNHIRALLYNQAGHLNVSVRNAIANHNYITLIDNTVKPNYSRVGQLELARYRFLADPRMKYALRIEYLALSHPDIPEPIRNDLFDALLQTLSLYE